MVFFFLDGWFSYKNNMLIMYYIYYDKKIVFFYKLYSIFINGFLIIFFEDYKLRFYNKLVCYRFLFFFYL